MFKRIFLLLTIAVFTQFFSAFADTKSIDDIYIRDPFIYTDRANSTYYMYCASSVNNRGGVAVWKSKDLKTWQGPEQVFTVSPNNRLTGSVWAPEMHKYKGKYYLFLTLNSTYTWKAGMPGRAPFYYRSVQIFKGNSPDGPFKEINYMSTRPIDEMALDGTLYVDEQGTPWLVYCNEWVQRTDGTIRLAQLAPDFSKIVSRPVDLFCASAAPWARPVNEVSGGYVTDGCYLYKGKQKLFMIWSSFNESGNYCIGVAESATGKITGPWIQHPTPLYSKHGGHASIFHDLSGNLRIVLHSPNSPSPLERAKILYLDDTGDNLVIKQ